MKYITVFLSLALLLCCSCFNKSKSIVMSIEVSELDCTALPELFEQYANEKEKLKQSDILNEIEKLASKTVMLQHSQKADIGELIEHNRQIPNSEFQLKLATKEDNKGVIHTDVDFSVSEGEHKKRAVKTSVGIKIGEPVVLGGMTTTSKVGKSDGTEEETKCISIIRLKIEKDG
jgi:hypothetical protein